MKKALLFLTMFVWVDVSFAQTAQKPTGGCGFNCEIVDINPHQRDTKYTNSYNLLYNDYDYEITVRLVITGIEPGYGYYVLMLQGDTLWKSDVSMYNYPPCTAKLPRFHYPEGEYKLKLAFYDLNCGDRSYLRTIYIRNLDSAAATPHITNITTREPNIVMVPDTVLTVYPIPATDKIFIKGLRSSEKTYKIMITDMEGRRTELNGDIPSSTISLATGDLPPGNYFLALETNERHIKTKIQILRK